MRKFLLILKYAVIMIVSIGIIVYADSLLPEHLRNGDIHQIMVFIVSWVSGSTIAHFGYEEWSCKFHKDEL